MPCDESWINCWPRDQETDIPVEACWLSQTEEGQTEQIHPQTFDDPFFWQHWHNLHSLGSHLTDSQQRMLCWGLREFMKRFRRERLALFKSGQWHFFQDNAPVHNSILVTDYLTKMGIKQFLTVPIVKTLLPVTFGYSLSSEAVVMRQLRRWKWLWRRSLTRS